MKMKLILFIGMVSVFFCLGAHAQEIPEDIKKLVPIYPGAELTSCQVSGEVTQVKLKTSAEPKAIHSWYKKQMIGDGWQIIYEREKPDNYRLVMTKGDLQFGFGVHRLPEKDTRFFYSIKKLAKKG